MTSLKWLYSAVIGFFGCGLLLVVCLLAKKNPPVDPDHARDEVTMDHIGRVTDLAGAFHAATGLWPRSKWDIFADAKDTNIFYDGWGFEFHFISNTNAPDALWIESYGADDKFGGQGTNSDWIVPLGKAQ